MIVRVENRKLSMGLLAALVARAIQVAEKTFMVDGESRITLRLGTR